MEDAFYNERNETGIAYTDDLRRKDARMPHWTDRNVNGKIRKQLLLPLKKKPNINCLAFFIFTLTT